MSETLDIAGRIPRLENGDRLTRKEFERRYQAMPDLKKAELIEGVVYVGSPVTSDHGCPHAWVMGWLTVYRSFTPEVEVFDNTTVRLDADNEPQPDALLRFKTGGQSIVSSDRYIEGAPELIVEIAVSSASYDLHDKFQVYRRNSVLEYLVWRVEDRAFDWFRLQDGEYIRVKANSEGIFCSEVFLGLWLDAEALLTGDLSKVFEVLQRGLASREN
ncbi:hypothetical protein AY599_03095 [Leptolyngbya valderiana BDU 20041]|nr:hypothetical protein AY599_03095 [Leptolyngbya valderiana BDU 20041]